MLPNLTNGPIDFGAWALAWARVLPSVCIVPAFGLGVLSIPVRLTFGLVLAASVAPALSPIPAAGAFWPLLLLGEAARGLPVALVAAAVLWAATMAGSVADDLRGAGSVIAPMGSTPLGLVFAWLAAIAFLETGGAARVAHALAAPGLTVLGPIELAAQTLAGGIEIAIAVATPVIALSVLVQLALGLMARAAGSELLASLASPIRSLVILGAAALLLDRMLGVLVQFGREAF
jgi:type III secretory pathway component EscT